MKGTYIFNEEWKDFFLLNEEESEPSEIKLTLLIEDNSRDLIDFELHKAFNNWMNEECENSVLLDNETGVDGLLQIPIVEYMIMWLNKLNINYEVV